jgi:hypothetical protein
MMATPAAARRPDCRPCPARKRVPKGCITFAVTDDRAEPFVFPGETALIDTADRVPATAAVFLFRWSDGKLSLGETNLRMTPLESGKTLCWFVDPPNRPRGRAEWAASSEAGRVLWSSDGPFAADDAPGADYLPSKIVGRLVGILDKPAEGRQRSGRDARQ